MEENFENQVQGSVQPNYNMGVNIAPQQEQLSYNNVNQNEVFTSNVETTVNNYVPQEQVYTQAVQIQSEPVQEVPVQAQVQEAPIPPAQPVVELKSPVDLKPEDIRIVVKTDILKEAVKKADTVAGKDSMQPFTEVIMFRVLEIGRASCRERVFGLV